MSKITSDGARKKIAIIGHGAEKFPTLQSERAVQQLITELLVACVPGSILVSGHSPMGGVDIWAEEIAQSLDMMTEIKAPKDMAWNGPYGFKARNLDIVDVSDELHVIVAKEYPEGYRGRRFKACYHCRSTTHVKSGACWTAHQALKRGKLATWHIL